MISKILILALFSLHLGRANAVKLRNDLPVCQCSDFTFLNFKNERVGNCLPVFTVRNRWERLCYVHIPADCPDGIKSGTLPGMMISRDACDSAFTFSSNSRNVLFDAIHRRQGLASENLVDEDDDDLQNLVDDVDADLESLADDDDEEFIEDEDDDLELLDESDVDFENLFPQIMLL